MKEEHSPLCRGIKNLYPNKKVEASQKKQGEPFYYCIKCEKPHNLNSKIGKRHRVYIPIFSGIYYPKKEVAEP